MDTSDCLSFRLLGAMQATRAGTTIELPPSRKTRALLAYLVLNERPQRREDLCQLLWEDTDDPKAALRWSLSRLRAALDEPQRPRLIANRSQVELDRDNLLVDLLWVRERSGTEVQMLNTQALIGLAQQFHGELLEGLELTDAHEFSAWCIAQRESARLLHVQVLSTLIERVADTPEQALGYARRLKRIEPYDEAVRAQLVRLLAAAGRFDEAHEQFKSASRTLHEAGIKPSGELIKSRELIRPGARSETVDVASNHAQSWGNTTHAPSTAPMLTTGVSFVGRAKELQALSRSFDGVRHGLGSVGYLLLGDPGVGKSRLMQEWLSQAHETGANVLQARCFEAELRRPYGVWVDAIQQLARTHTHLETQHVLELLLGDSTNADTLSTRERLFASVSALVSSIIASAPTLVLALDDLQWMDEPSITLLHYVTRMNRHCPLFILVAARRGELRDNFPVMRVVQTLRRDEQLRVFEIDNLSRGEVKQLAQSVSPGVDADQVFADSSGNPLFAIEISRALAAGGFDMPHTFADVVGERVDRLPEPAMDVLRWCAVLGQVARPHVLEALPQYCSQTLLPSLEHLDRDGLLVDLGDRSNEGAYGFAHELVRRVVYEDLSTPRRRFMHGQIAQALESISGASDELAIEIANHAALAGDSARAARACIAAARRCVRVFASDQALDHVRRGIHYAQDVGEPTRCELMLELLDMQVNARRPDDLQQSTQDIEHYTRGALDHGNLAAARLGFYLLSLLRLEHGDWDGARNDSLHMEELSRSGDERDRVMGLAINAHCLLSLECEIERAGELVSEAAVLVERSGYMPGVFLIADGMLKLRKGQLELAAERLREARLCAQRDGERLTHFSALEQLVRLALQDNALDEACRLSDELNALGERVRGGSESVFARAMWALTRYYAGERSLRGELDRCLDELEQHHSPYRLSYLLSYGAQAELNFGDYSRALHRARQAVDVSSELKRPSELAMAIAALAHAAEASDDNDTLNECISKLKDMTLADCSHEAQRHAASLLSTREQRAVP